MEKILVIIITYNAMKWAQHCFNSLHKSNTPVNVLVIDNGSTDGTQEYIQQFFPEFIFIQSKTNLGFGKANNIGLQKVLNDKYDYAYLLNQDAWIMPDTLEKLISIHKSNPSYGVLSPMQMEASMHNLDHNFTVNVVCSSLNCISDMFCNQIKDVYDVNFVMAAHWLISRKCIEVSGGFSPTFPHYGEDDNYLSRVLYWKMKVGIVPSAIAVHDRENRYTSEEKHIYITKYIQVLIAVSNPLNPISLIKYIKAYIIRALHFREKWPRIYALKFYHTRKSIKNNYIQSLKPCAFLIKRQTS